MSSVSYTNKGSRAALALIGLLLVAINLRPALTSVSPVLKNIAAGLSLSPAAQGVLTTLPVVCLGLAAPLAPKMSRRIGPERTIFIILILLAVTLLVRPFSGMLGLFVFTALAGACIGLMNVLLPGIVKRDFPTRVSLMTGLYTVALNLGASLAAGATEPLRQAFGDQWQPSLAFWLVPAVIAALVWIPQLRVKHTVRVRPRQEHSLYRNTLAWQVTLFMGLQSSLAYTVFGWLPTILQDRGVAPVTAGLALSVSILFQVITAIVAPLLGGRMKDQRAVLIVVMLLTLCGLAGCLYAPIQSVWLWVVILGLGQGGTFSMALTLLALRAPDADTASELSGMAQGFGYVLAAFGPLLVGLLHDWSGGWDVVGILLGLIGLAAMIVALGAGRNRLVRPHGST
ncbi:CynX/NimT family MFS transporter [Kushneria marisflavi]|uniref:Cyanate transporter n=1 Tax=Kushneria marisflavi TaxID=157779 RepID=A0A240UTG8_9GAMM|nr:MFS transporter [Kushneria marisflavi]ART64791.1 cyanate transporter [Kushneria marisflavi]RKD85730.1 CP family cyanate transporter-like MFS transporter [Kushneria marisflavi]